MNSTRVAHREGLKVKVLRADGKDGKDGEAKVNKVKQKGHNNNN